MALNDRECVYVRSVVLGGIEEEVQLSDNISLPGCVVGDKEPAATCAILSSALH